MLSDDWSAKQKEQSEETSVWVVEVPTIGDFGSKSGKMSQKSKLGLTTLEEE